MNKNIFRSISSNRSRSDESIFVSNGSVKGPLGSILSAKPIEILLDNCHVRHLQSSSLNDNHYQFIEIKNKIFYLRSKNCLSENNLLLNDLEDRCLDKMMDILRIDNSLDIYILEAKGLREKKSIFILIYFKIK